jgi:hypothetical protein
MFRYSWQQTNLPAPRWDSYLMKFLDYNCLQTSAYASLNQERSGSAFQSLLLSDDTPVAMGQGVLRQPRILPVAVVTFRGGPLYALAESEPSNLRYLKRYLLETVDYLKGRFRFYYINMIIHAEATVNAKIVLRELGWTLPLLQRSPHWTQVVPVFEDSASNFKALDSKWRNQLRKAESAGPIFQWGNDDSLLLRYVRLHNEMCRFKQMENFRITIDEMRTMRQCLDRGILFLVGTHEDQDVCGCVAVITEQKAVYYYAAANELARSKYLSNAMVWKLINLLRERGVRELDLTGIDPGKNWGGYHFKKGIGGRSVEYLGEWEYASHSSLKRVMNLALYLKSSRLYRDNGRPTA